jgi:hypothetical protein
MQIAKQRWYLARYQQVNGRWETQVLFGESWDAKWMAIDAARERSGGFMPFRGEFLRQQQNLVFMTEESEATA